MTASKAESVLLTVTIDTECDHDPIWTRSNPLKFDSINEGIPNRLQPVFREAGAVPTYLLTVEVMEDASSVHSLKNIAGPHELGTHLHAAFIEPEKKYLDYAGIDSPDFQCFYSAEVEHRKLENLTRLFENNFGYAPVSFRAGRYGASEQSIEALQKLGYLVDTSVTPHIKWSEPKGSVDFRSAPEQPYFPSAASIVEVGKAGQGSLLEMPVTMKKRFVRGPRWFRPWFSSVDQMKEIVRYHLKRYVNQPVISINMMFHSMEVIEKASPYPQTHSDVERFLDSLSSILHWCSAEGIESVSTKDFYHRYSEKML